MLSFRYCNIDKNDRINRSIFGIVLILCVIFDVSKITYVIFGLILIIEGVVGWCYIPKLISKIKRKY